MSKVLYYVAASVDGFIADADGKFDWLNNYEIPGEDYGYKAFYEGIGAVILGSTTYMDIRAMDLGWMYPGIESVVMTRRDLPRFPDTPLLRFAQGDIAPVIADLKTRTVPAGKDIWIVGGGDLAGQALRVGLLDEIHLTTMPILLGKGAPLMAGFAARIPLHAKASATYPGGVMQAIYDVGEA